jgi:putative ABC transport system substrate-binding protein
VAVLMGLSRDGVGAKNEAVFRTTMQGLGWREGENVAIAFHWAAGSAELATTLARDIVRRSPDVVVGHTTPCVAALTAATRDIPIVFIFVSDPIGSGFVRNLAEPGGNVTGFINLEGSLASKWVEVLKDLTGDLAHAGMLYNPDTAPRGGDYYLGPFESAAGRLGVMPVKLPVRNDGEIDGAFHAIGAAGRAGVIIMPDVFVANRLRELIAAADRHRVPVLYPYRFMVEAGGLASYGVDNLEFYAKAATYVDRILKGEHPSRLPVQQPTKFEFVLNARAARALNLTIPPTLLARADEVIE